MILSNLTVSRSDHQKLSHQGNIMITGLRGCDEIARNFWLNKTLPVPPKLVTNAGDSSYTQGLSASFPTNPWLCRNKTLRLALEDLSDNITMSLIGSADT
jgi:hypothetical protein